VDDTIRFEPVEANPMIGFRGCYRYIEDPEIFALELDTVARVREQYPNLQLMIPFVRTKWELERCLAAIDRSPLGSDRRLEVWVMVEVPSIIYRIPDYAAMGLTASRSAATTSHNCCWASIATPRRAPPCSTRATTRCSGRSNESSPAAAPTDSPSRSAGRLRRIHRSSPNAWSGSASTRSRSTPTPWHRCGTVAAAEKRLLLDAHR
jgi:hypothetical protein